MELLTVSTSERDGWIVLALVGQLDVATAPNFRETLQETQYRGDGRVVLDLSGLEFLDSFGLGVLVGGVKRARSHGGRLILAGVSDHVAQVFELTGLDRALPFAPDVDAAIGT